MAKKKNSSRKEPWEKADMVMAIKDVIRYSVGYKAAAQIYNVPKTTLVDYVQKVRKEKIPLDSISAIVRRKVGRKTVLSPALEEELVKYCTKMDEMYYGLRRKDIRTLAFQLAIQNNLRHPFTNGESAGKKWLKLFMSRHPQLSFRKPELVSIARAQAFTKEKIAKFFNILQPELTKIKFNPNRLFNCDEAGTTVVQHNPQQHQPQMSGVLSPTNN